MEDRKISRADVIAGIGATPIAIGALAALTAAEASAAADNKKQFKYQDKPGPHGQKCSGCTLFVAPHSCKVVHGKISPNGWCIAFSPKH